MCCLGQLERIVVRKTFLLNAFFFCDKPDNLHECRTLYLDMTVRKIAHDVNNITHRQTQRRGYGSY